jgi:membrane protein
MSDAVYRLEKNWLSHSFQALRSAATGVYRNNCLSTAKGAAYSGLLSFFPVLTTLAAILVHTHSTTVAHTLTTFLSEVVPPGTEDVVRNLFDRGERPNSLLIVAIVLAVWAASGAMISLMEGFQATYHIPSGRPFLQERGVAVLLVMIAVLPAVGASAIIAFGTHAEKAVVGWMGFLPETADFSDYVPLAGQVLSYAIAFATFVVVTAMVYYFGPNRKQRWSLVFPGAFLATGLWMLATLAFGWYVRHVSDYNLLYGSVGAGLALLVWMYVLAVITLFGCEFNAATERMRFAPLLQ